MCFVDYNFYKNWMSLRKVKYNISLIEKFLNLKNLKALTSSDIDFYFFNLHSSKTK